MPSPGGPRPRPLAAFITDLDRTLLRPGGAATPVALAALREVRGLGLRTLLVSGRPYADLRRYAAGFAPWDALVAEGGSVVEAPAGQPPTVFGRRTGAAVRRRLAADPDLHPERGVVIASVPRGERLALLRAVKGVPVDVIPNVDRLMVVPAGVTKSTGIRVALRRLGLAGGGYAAIGDAENDVEMLRGADFSGCVANAISGVRSQVDYVCHEWFDRGVEEFVHGPLRARVLAWSGGGSPSGGSRGRAPAPR